MGKEEGPGSGGSRGAKDAEATRAKTGEGAETGETGKASEKVRARETSVPGPDGEAKWRWAREESGVEGTWRWEREEWKELQWNGLGEPAKERPSDLETVALRWEVPLADLLVSRPLSLRPASQHEPRRVEVGPLGLGFQLAVVQGEERNWLRLSQTSEEGLGSGEAGARGARRLGGARLPLLGVEWAGLAERRDGGRPSELGPALREALGALRPRGRLPRLLQPRSVWARRHALPGDKVGVIVLVRQSPSLLSPKAVSERLLREAREGEPGAGLLGGLLWEQVEAGEEGGALDVEFQCEGGLGMGAHRAVLATLGPKLRPLLREGERWEVEALPVAGLGEALHFLYLGRFSEGLDRAPLGGVLEAGRLLGLGRAAALELEALLLEAPASGLSGPLLRPARPHQRPPLRRPP